MTDTSQRGDCVTEKPPPSIVTVVLQPPPLSHLSLPSSHQLSPLAVFSPSPLTHHPTLISMLHSTEILISLVTEALWWNELPGTVSLLGSLLVAACVFTMAAHDKIMAALRESKMKETEVEEEKTIDSGV